MVNTGQTRASQAYDAAKRAHQVEKEAAVLSAQREADERAANDLARLRARLEEDHAAELASVRRLGGALRARVRYHVRFC